MLESDPILLVTIRSYILPGIYWEMFTYLIIALGMPHAKNKRLGSVPSINERRNKVHEYSVLAKIKVI